MPARVKKGYAVTIVDPGKTERSRRITAIFPSEVNAEAYMVRGYGYLSPVQGMEKMYRPKVEAVNYTAKKASKR